VDRERIEIVTRQPLTRGNDDYDSENSWSSGEVPSSRRRRKRGGGGEGGESGEKVGGRSKSTVESTAPKVSLRSRAGEAMNEAPRISPRVSAKSPSSELFSLSSSLAAASQRSR